MISGESDVPGDTLHRVSIFVVWLVVLWKDCERGSALFRTEPHLKASVNQTPASGFSPRIMHKHTNPRLAKHTAKNHGNRVPPHLLPTVNSSLSRVTRTKFLGGLLPARKETVTDLFGGNSHAFMAAALRCHSPAHHFAFSRKPTLRARETNEKSGATKKE